MTLQALRALQLYSKFREVESKESLDSVKLTDSHFYIVVLMISREYDFSAVILIHNISHLL